jgi:hypothetical protein
MEASVLMPNFDAKLIATSVTFFQNCGVFEQRNGISKPVL